MAVSKGRLSIIGVAATAATAGSSWGEEEERDVAYKRKHDGCIRTSPADMQSQGIDSAANGMPQKIQAYCDCIVTEAKAKQPALSSIDPNSSEGQAKTAELIQACAAKLQ